MVIGSGTTVAGLCCTPNTMSLKSRSIGSGAFTSRISSKPTAVPVKEPHNSLPQLVATFERMVIEQCLRMCGGSVTRASEVLSVPWIRNAIFETAEDDRWEQRAAQAMADDLSRAHQRLVAQVIRGRDGGDVRAAADRTLQSRGREVARYRALLDEIRGEPVMSLSGLSVAVREIASLSERMNGSG